MDEPGPEVATAYLVERDVPVPMRDGTVLRADVHRPREPGRYPVLVERVAYELSGRAAPYAGYYAGRGYAVVAQNVRGTYASGGRFTLLRDDGWGERQDGADTIAWAAAQPWSSGKVGMLDGSYSGFTQYLAAAARPPELTALYVREGGPDVYHDLLYRGGVPRLGVARSWALRSLVLPQVRHPPAPPERAAARPRLEAASAELDRWLRHLPLRAFPPLEGLGDLRDWLTEALDHPEDGAYWWPVTASRRSGEVDVPALHLGGWFDGFQDGTLRAFAGYREHARSAAARAAQRLVVGPWVHGPANVGQREVGALDFGAAAAFDLNAHRLRWYDHWLKGAANGALDGPPVRVFLMGANRWLDLDAWPPPSVAATPLYLRAGAGRSAESLNNGGLTFEAPGAEESPDRFTDDPADPAPSLPGGVAAGPRHQRPLEGRLLTYTTAPLARDLTVLGRVTAVLFGASSAPDTDWVVRLCDVWPDGRAMGVCDGILRARYRAGLDRAERLVPDRVYRFDVDLWSTAQVFAAGHRIRVDVASSEFPRYARNLHTGGAVGGEVEGRVAVNTVRHDASAASHVLLPVLAS
jgi:putative CocE/NonD family hydrolase